MTKTETWLHLVALGVALLFFWDVGTACVEAAYAFGLLATEVPPAVGLVAFAFLAPLALVPFARPLPRAAFLALVGVAFACRASEPWLDRLPRVIVAGIGFGALLLLLPVWLERLARCFGRAAGALSAAALALACTAAALWRVGGIDASRHAAIAEALFGFGALYLATRSEQQPTASPSTGFGRTLALVLGIACALLLALVLAPGVMARWFDMNPAIVHALVVSSVACALALLAFAPERLRPLPLALAVLAFGVALGAALFVDTPAFPAGVEGYPFEPAKPASIAAIAALALSGTVPLAVAALAGELGASSPRKLAIAFGLGGLAIFILVTAQILTTIYDYVPVVGSVFRNRFWLVTAFPTLGIAAALLAVRAAPERSPPPALLALLVLGAATVVASRATEPTGPEVAPSERLRVVSYNIQQGFAADGRRGLRAQLALLEKLDADVIGLQECDTSRLAGANADTVRYLARALGMHAHYGPPPPAGTFGVALLSRHRIASARTVYLHSTGEQTAAVIATIAVGDRSYTIAVTHLGNDGPIVQQQNLLAALEGPTLLTGDFNFVTGSPQYRLTRERFADAWEVAASKQGTKADRDLDHVFVTRGPAVRETGYLRDPASDHPAVFAELDLR